MATAKIATAATTATIHLGRGMPRVMVGFPSSMITSAAPFR
jgi:hypothetical protein